MHTKTCIVAAMSVVALAAVGAGPAFAGEIKGPTSPTGTPAGSGKSFTEAPANANSICASSGLNHFHEGEPGELADPHAVVRAARPCWLQD